MALSCIEHQLNHRSIRKFIDKAVSDEIVRQLVHVAQRTASSTNMQYCSIIRVVGTEKRKRLDEITGQSYVSSAPEVWLMLVDSRRAAQVQIEKGRDASGAGSMDVFFQGFTDACLMAQNVVNAAESVGLGTCFLGSVLNDSKAVIELFELPKLTFPVVAIMFGYPDQQPQRKPRMSMDLRMFEDKYRIFDSYLDALKDHDEQMTQYYDLRQPSKPLPAYTEQVDMRLSTVMPNRRKMLQVVAAQGFDLGLG